MMSDGTGDRLKALRHDLEMTRAIAEDIRAGRNRPGQASALLDPEKQAEALAVAEADIRRLEQVIAQIEGMQRPN